MPNPKIHTHARTNIPVRENPHTCPGGADREYPPRRGRHVLGRLQGGPIHGDGRPRPLPLRHPPPDLISAAQHGVALEEEVVAGCG